VDVEDLGVEGVVGQIFLGHLEEIQLVSKLVNLQVKVLDLDCHCLVIVDQRALLFLTQSDLLDQVLCSQSLVLVLLGHRKALVCLDEFPFRVYNHCLELISLSHELL